MLQINEVKIDNYVTSSKGDIFQISTGAFCLYHQNKEWDVLSIELTEEWLFRFGFKKLVNDWQIKGLIIHTRKRGFVVNKRIAIIKYVHQLQNLYYALTQTELTLKDEK